jgi:hypothetical protein
MALQVVQADNNGLHEELQRGALGKVDRVPERIVGSFCKMRD